MIDESGGPATAAASEELFSKSRELSSSSRNVSVKYVNELGDGGGGGGSSASLRSVRLFCVQFLK